MTQAARFRELLRRDGMVVAPGAYDCITAKLIEAAGFEAVYMTGAGTAATLGYPDFGLVTMSEMVGNAERIAAAVGLPVIADADTGYGNELNVYPHGARIRAQRGCRHPYRGPGIPEKMRPSRRQGDRAARGMARQNPRRRRARRDPDFLIIARTDARAVAGFDEAIARANAALAAGAEMVFVEAPQTIEEVGAVPRLVRGPCLLNVVYGGKTPDLDLREAERLGYKMAILPGLLLKCVVGICEQKLGELKTEHRHPAPVKEMTVREMFERVGAAEWDARRTQFRGPAPIRNAAE